MHIDVTQHIGSSTRDVSTRSYEGKAARVVSVSRHYHTSPADLWDAITKADRIPRWFLPVTGDLKPGGRYQLQGNAGGQILICEPPRHLTITWEYGGEMSWVEVRLAGDGAGSRLTLEHFSHGGDEHWNQFGPGATGVGWDLALLGLSEHTAAGSAKTAEEGMAWMMSENGKAFVRASSEAWGHAHVAAGTDQATAAAAVARTTAAYTGA
jgi:uncharacterized protein YndB with AHSA1/START domain